MGDGGDTHEHDNQRHRLQGSVHPCSPQQVSEQADADGQTGQRIDQDQGGLRGRDRSGVIGVLGQEQRDHTGDGQTIGLPMDEHLRPVGRHIVADGLDQGGRERKPDGPGGAEHGGPPPPGPAEGQEHGQHHHSPTDGRHDDPVEGCRHLISTAGLGKDKESGKASGGGKTPQPLTQSDPESKPGGQQEHDEQQLGGQDGLHLAQISEMEGHGLEQE